ncbi:MAG: site-specific integrase [Gemmatimonadetes bacterium]|nr:site-specific integrase [Gemmatimonadota bacterium]
MDRGEAGDMSPFKRGAVFYVDVRWKGYPRLYLSTDTTNKARATAIERTLYALRSAGRRDLLGLLAAGKVTLPELHDAHERRGDELEQLKAKADSPRLGELVDVWEAWLSSPSGISPRTGRRYAAHTTRRYSVSWANFFAAIPQGRDATLSALNKGFVADYRRMRSEAGAGPATINRDLGALMAFLTWCAEERGLAISRPAIKREREPSGRERWLSSDEIRGVRKALPDEWWPFFATLVYTGLRFGEAHGLRGADVKLKERRIVVQEADRRVKSASSVRHVPIAEPLAQWLGEHFARHPCGPTDQAFPFLGLHYDRAYKAARQVWRKAAIAAGLHDGGVPESADATAGGKAKKPKPAKPNATIHDLRHTFGVHAAQAGVAVGRLQGLMGHAAPIMTMRYLKHAPEAYFTEDAAKVAGSLGGDQEGAARAEMARRGIKRA